MAAPHPFRRDLAELVRLAGPVAATRFGTMAMAVTDTVVVGRYSATELGYMTLGWAPTGVVLVTGMGLLAGTPVVAARRVGEGRRGEAGAVLRRGAVQGLWLGLISSLVLWTFGPPLLAASGLAPDLAAGAGRVLQVFAYSLTTQLLTTVCSSWLEAMGRPGAATAAMWLANGANLAFDLVLVPGGFGLPALGAAGAAWSTFFARAILLVLLVALLARTAEGRGLFRPAPRDRAAETEQRRIGYGGGAAFFVETGAFSAMSIVAGLVGGLAVGGWAIVLNVASIIFMGPLGVATAASVLVARALGAEDWAELRRSGLAAFGLAAGLGAVVSVAVFVGARLVADAYTRDPALAGITAAALQLACLFFVADGLQVVGAHALRAAGDVAFSTGVQVASYALVMLPLGYALALPAGLGLAGIVWAVVAASLMSSGLLVARFLWVSRPA